jgi:large subunit ribosomal protein L26e
MKYNNNITRSRKKNRKRVFTSSSCQKRKTMISPVSKEIRLKYHRKSVPLRKDFEVIVRKGLFKGKSGKIVQCQRKTNKVFVDNLVRNKTNKTSSFIPVSPSNLMVISVLGNLFEKKTMNGNKKF